MMVSSNPSIMLTPVIKRPMDLSTILRNIKAHKYKSKAEFAADLDLIWENCFTYNTHEVGHEFSLVLTYRVIRFEHKLVS